jgi:hypothetical protein
VRECARRRRHGHGADTARTRARVRRGHGVDTGAGTGAGTARTRRGHGVDTGAGTARSLASASASAGAERTRVRLRVRPGCGRDCGCGCDCGYGKARNEPSDATELSSRFIVPIALCEKIRSVPDLLRRRRRSRRGEVPPAEVTGEKPRPDCRREAAFRTKSIRATPPALLAGSQTRTGEKNATATTTGGTSLPTCDARSIAPVASAGNS